MNKAIENNNNKNNTITQSQCHSSSNKELYKIKLETTLENTTLINTVATSAATGHFFPNKNNRKNSHNIIEVVCADNQTMESVATTALDIPELSTKAKTAFHFNKMQQPLLSIPLLADVGCKINLTKDNIVKKKDEILMKGIRDKISTLLMIPIKHHKKEKLLAQELPYVPPVHAANSAYPQPPIAKLMAFLNATIGSLPVKTLCNAIDNDWLTSFPWLTSSAIRKHLQKSIINNNGTHAYD
jgi:hypothetical protein